MIAAMILFIGAVVVVAALGDGALGPAALGVLIVIVLLCMGRSERKDSQAYVARREYWRKEGGFK